MFPAKPLGRLSLTNLALSAGVLAALVAILEGVSRWTEPAPTPSEDIVGIWNWEKEWHGDFYVLGSGSLGWPPRSQINRDGLRDEARPRAKARGLHRIVCLGDSVTFGDGIGPGKAYPQVMDALLRERGYRAEVFNVALPGWSTRQERIAYARIGRAYRPDRVLLGVCLNDMPELHNNLAAPPPLLAELHRRSALVRRLVDARGRELRSVEELFQRPEPGAVRAAYERFFAEVRSLRAEVEADGATLALVLFPYRFQLERAVAPAVQERVLEFCASEKLPCLDLLPGLRQRGIAAFRDANHLSPAGALYVAEKLMRVPWIAPGPTAEELLAQWQGPQGWLAALSKGPAAVRAAAAFRYRGHPGLLTPPVVAALTRALGDEDEAVRIEAARTIGGWTGAALQAAVGRLAPLLDDSSEPVRWEAAQALWRAAPPASLLMPFLTRALESADEYVRSYASWTLGEAGVAARQAVPALVLGLRNPEAWGAAGAALALGKIGPDAAEAVPSVIPALSSNEPAIRARAAQVLGLIGPRAQSSLPSLEALVADPDGAVRLQCVRALGRIGTRDEGVLRALATATRDPAPDVRTEAEAARAALQRR